MRDWKGPCGSKSTVPQEAWLPRLPCCPWPVTAHAAFSNALWYAGWLRHVEWAPVDRWGRAEYLEWGPLLTVTLLCLHPRIMLLGTVLALSSWQVVH